MISNETETEIFVMQVPGQGLEWRESGETVLYLQIIIILISYIIIELLIKREIRTILAETGNGTPLNFVSLQKFIQYRNNS